MDGVGHIIGIDLGTTNSVVAVVEGGEPRVILNAEGQTKTPSVVALMENGDIVVGEIARRQASTQPQRTISSAKRLIGRLAEEIRENEEKYPFEIDENPADGRVMIRVGDREYFPEEFSSLVLMKLREAAETYLGEPVTRAVITVPAYFDDLQRQATMEAAKLAGLEVMRLLNEPTAAAMAYGLAREEDQLVAVYDFGGGTFDFSLLEIEGKTFEVLVSTGNSQLGGDDVDTLLVDLLADQFLETHGCDLREDPMALRRLRDAAEQAKCELSSARETLVSLPFVYNHNGQALHLQETITRERFESLVEPLIEETLACCTRGLRQTKFKKSDIKRVILVGGSTRIPYVQEMVEDFFGLVPFKGLNPDEIVAQGAAAQGAVMNGELEEVILLDVTPHTLGIEIKGNRKSTLIDKNSTIPIKVFKTFTTTEDGQSFVNIHVLQGDESQASQCRSVGKFTLAGIEKCPAGIPRIRVTFFINADGILEIGAEDMQSGSNKTLTISHAFLSGEERRAQAQSNRRRRKKAGDADRFPASAMGKKFSRRSSELSEVAAATPLPKSQSEAPKDDTNAKSRGSLGTTFAEIRDTPGSQTAAALAQQLIAPVNPAPAEAPRPRTPAEAAETDYNLNKKPAPAAPAPAAVPAAAAQAATQTPFTPAPASPAAPAVAEPPMAAAASADPHLLQCMQSAPSELEGILEQLGRNANDSAALIVYQENRDAFLEFCRAHTADTPLQLMLARFHIFTKQAEEARSILDRVRLTAPEMAGAVKGTYSQLCEEFPNYIAARKDRAALAAASGDFNQAMEDLEFVAKREEGDEEVLERLGKIYEMVLSESSDSTVQFKLVKLHLKKHEVDEAIQLLQQMVGNPEYRDRANKVLGLCFWQKGMRYLAWQKFRALPVSEELKDTLYRLADDMEINDELLHAKYALERIYEVDIGYKDVAERLKKLIDRMELQKDERYGSMQVKPALVDGIGELGGRFDVIGEINRGSMGIVYKARDLIVDEIVAIKVLNDFLCSDPQAIERFKLEARSARKLTHQNVVRIHDLFELEKKRVISMEYIEGENLKTLLARQATFTEDMIMGTLMQVCEGLAYAHRLHIVHRDIKPANIMLTDRGVVKITDFGIAKLLTDHQTKAGTMVMGTPLYMAPEQIEGGRIDRRCDIYSLGIMLYEMVTGRPPFSDGNIEYQHIHSKAPVITVGVSEKLKHVITKCIEKNPADRFQHVEEILARVI